ncbi:MAG: outer membrane protein assembly factor BamD [Gammaproteobacteria bacterium]|nr:outer membrane protein assembly factor BamD [Gammaproteobacteria bacterium]
MIKMLNLRASLLATILAIPLAGIATLVLPAEAVAQAQSSGGWRKEVADKVKSAQEASAKGNFSEAIRLLKEAKAKAPLSPQEEQGVNEYLIYAASSAKDHKLVLQTVDERIATGRLTGADLIRKLRLKATTLYTIGDYRSAAAAFNQLIATQGSATADDLILLGNSQLVLRDYRAAIPTLEKAVVAAQKAGKPATTIGKLLEGLAASYSETKNEDKQVETLHRLIAVTPKASAFKYLASAYEVRSKKDPVVMINIYRLGASRGLLTSDHYAKYAEVALDMASPGEAAAMLEKGMSVGAIKKDDRNNRLLADAKSQVARLKAGLAQLERETMATKNGDAEAKLATAYFTLKNYAKATEAGKRGIDEGKLRRPDDLNMLLGIALVESKKSAEAKNAFKAAAAANENIRGVADLWVSMST